MKHFFHFRAVHKLFDLISIFDIDFESSLDEGTKIVDEFGSIIYVDTHFSEVLLFYGICTMLYSTRSSCCIVYIIKSINY